MRKILLMATVFGFVSMPVLAMDTDVVDDHGKPMEEVEQERQAGLEVQPETVHHAAVHWGYAGEGRPSQWGAVNPGYALCGAGQEQSPVNIEKFARDPNAAPLAFSYKPSNLDVVNNGHTVKVDYAPGSTLMIDGKSYELKQFHFHTPSEHYVVGAPYPMEVHFVHAATDGSLAVVGALIKVGKHNKIVQGIWQNVPAQTGVGRVLDDVEYNVADLLPEDKGYYHYEGSLTTPPCTEGVQWYVLRSPIEISEEQLKVFQDMFPVNARPVQNLNGRVLTGN